MTTWEESELWLRLKSAPAADGAQVRDGLGPILRAAEAVLQKGGTQPPSFTLHDEGHALRVAKRMAELAGPVLDTLTHYELALLLASAYLHDIGMAPEGEVLEQLRRMLLGEDHEGLPAEMVDAVITWRDEHPEAVAIPVPPDHPHRVEAAEQVLAQFVRAAHNDWSQRWIEEMTPSTLGQYAEWRGDLIRLCRSHHEGYVELSSQRFDGRLVGNPGSSVNLRYLAMLLRIADVLELDPERTPPVILEHRLIDPASVVYWQKDRHMSLAVNGSGSIVIHSRPPTAVIHRAVLETVDGIDAELAVCRRLALEGLASRTPVGAAPRYSWPYEAAVTRDIREGGEYRYIDGAFRPNTRRLLDLLGGVELYKDPLVAVRELLQNAFDAVREELAWVRLERPDHFARNEDWRALAETHHVDLDLTLGNAPTLVCRDTGVGMNERILRDYLLVSGSAERPDATRLARLARHAGFSVGRTGRFGIGVLSYFMLAGEVVIATKRSSRPGDGEANGWKFQTRGVGSFGELCPTERSSAGTTITLVLRAEQVGSLAHGLVDQVERWVAHAPCRLSVSIAGTTILDTGPGFTFTPRRSVAHAPTPEWRTEEAVLPDNMGTYRLDVPVWQVDGAPALARPTSDYHNGERLVSPQVAIEPEVSVLAWRGMTVWPRFRDSLDRRPAGLALERLRAWGSAYQPSVTSASVAHATAVVNLTNDDAGVVAVDRGTMALSDDGQAAVNWATGRLRELQTAIASEDLKGPWALLNHRIAKVLLPPKLEDWQWLIEPTLEGRGRWGAIRFPVLQDFTLAAGSGLGLAFRGKRLQAVQNLFYGGTKLAWAAAEWSPDLVASHAGSVVGMFCGPPTSQSYERRLDGAQFPPEWSAVAGVTVARSVSGQLVAFNRENLLVQRSYLDGDWGSQVNELLLDRSSSSRGELDPVDLPNDPRLLASWLLLALAGKVSSVRSRSQNLPAWWEEIWSRLELPEGSSILFWSDLHGSRGLHVLDSRSWQFRDAQLTESGMAMLPSVHADWMVHRVL